MALETLKIYEEDDMLSHVRSIAPRMQAGLRRFADHPLVGEVRGIGLIGAVELVADKASKTPFDPAEGVGPFLVKRAPSSRRDSPATGRFHRVLSAAHHQGSGIDMMFERFALALDDTFAMVRERGLVESGLVPAMAK